MSLLALPLSGMRILLCHLLCCLDLIPDLRVLGVLGSEVGDHFALGADFGREEDRRIIFDLVAQLRVGTGVGTQRGWRQNFSRRFQIPETQSQLLTRT